MSDDRERLSTIFAGALARTSPAERNAYLDQACAGDTALRQRVEELLRAGAEAGSFLETPPCRPAVDPVETTSYPGVPARGRNAPPRLGNAPVQRQKQTTPVLRRIGDYELLKVLGRGGMGVVYKARQTSLNRLVALKMVRADQLETGIHVRRFQLEAEAVAALEHPNIVPIYEVGEHKGQPFFTMQLIQGTDLASELAAGRWQPGEKKSQLRAARLVAELARAVYYAHQHGILHRDLKPANILLDTNGRPLLTDFGLARRVAESTGLTEYPPEVAGPALRAAPDRHGESRLTQSGQIVGTPAYVAPEQARGQKDLTTAVDIYGLGAVLYELLTGRPPFRGPTVLDTLLQVIDDDPPRPRSLQANVNPELETICLKCLDKDPTRRYESAEALAQDLERWQRCEPIWAQQVTISRRLLKWARRRKAVVALLGVTACLLVAGVLTVRWQERAQEENQERLRQLISDNLDREPPAASAGHDDAPKAEIANPR